MNPHCHSVPLYLYRPRECGAPPRRSRPRLARTRTLLESGHKSYLRDVTVTRHQGPPKMPRAASSAMGDRLWRTARTDTQLEIATFRDFMQSAQSSSEQTQQRDAEPSQTGAPVGREPTASLEVEHEDDDQERADGPALRTVVTESGLRVEILREGTRRFPSATSTVDVHYTGYLARSGAVFDGSRSKVPSLFSQRDLQPVPNASHAACRARRAHACRCASEWAREKL